MTDLVAWLHRNADDCEDQSRWATPELAPFLREAATALEAKEKEIEAALTEQRRTLCAAHDADIAELKRVRAVAKEAIKAAEARAENAERELKKVTDECGELRLQFTSLCQEFDIRNDELKTAERERGL